MTEQYTHENIKVLDEISHIRLNAGMYIGETSTPVHLIEEALDNALDECMGGYCKAVAINLNTKDHVYCIIDNGRGIPIENDTPITISTKLFSGAKFQDSKSSYNVSSGLHGVGLVAILALSDSYVVEIYRNNTHAKFTFENQKLKNKIVEEFKGSKPFSTKIQFKPSKKIFENTIPDIDRIRRRLYVASAELKDCTFLLNIDDVKEYIKLDPDEFFKKYCLNDGDTNVSDTIFINSKLDNKEKFNIKFSYSFDGTLAPRVFSSVNLLPVDNGGIHVNLFLDLIKEFFSNKAKKAGIKIQPTDVFCGLRAYLSLELINPEFSGQSKEKLINKKEYLIKLINKLKQTIEIYFNNNGDKLESLLSFFEEYRRKLDSKKIKTRNNFGKRPSTKFTKLRDCTSANGELFIVEGDSAGGGLIQCRDTRKHAILPLKGKIPNAVNADDILKNKEIEEFIRSLGTGVGPNFDISNLKYDKIISATDADADGGHISCLLTIAASILVPEIVKQGKLYIARTPLYAITEKNTFIPLWTEKELSLAKQENKKISRFKGLGELNPSQLKICLIDENTRKLIRVEYSSDINKILKLFSDVNEKRKLLEGTWSL